MATRARHLGADALLVSQRLIVVAAEERPTTNRTAQGSNGLSHQHVTGEHTCVPEALVVLRRGETRQRPLDVVYMCPVHVGSERTLRRGRCGGGGGGENGHGSQGGGGGGRWWRGVRVSEWVAALRRPARRHPRQQRRRRRRRRRHGVVGLSGTLMLNRSRVVTRGCPRGAKLSSFLHSVGVVAIARRRGRTVEMVRHGPSTSRVRGNAPLSRAAFFDRHVPIHVLVLYVVARKRFSNVVGEPYIWW